MEKIVKAGLRDCTVILDGSECAVKFDSCFRAFAVRNDGAADVFISKASGTIPDGDGVMCVKSGASAVFAHMDIYADTVYLLGNGRVQLHAQNDSANPFNFAPTFDGGVMAEGNPVQIDGLQEGVPFSEMVVSGKNLLKYPYNESTKTVNGITFTDNGDGTITANGTATANATFLLAQNFGFEKEGNYFLSGCPSGGGLNSFYINWYQNHTGVTIKNYNDYGSGCIIPYQHIFSENNSLAISIIAGATVENLVFRPQLELGDTHTDYEPPITGRELTVNVCGKNLFDGNLIIGMIQTSTGIMTGGSQYLSTPNYISVNGDCTYSLSNFENKQFDAVVYYDFNKSYISATPLNRVEPLISHFTTPQNCKYIRWRYLFDNGASIDMLTNIQLELGDTATAYEPYHGSTTTITPDSNPYVIPNDIRQQDGLNVVSVSAGEISVTGVRKNAAIKRIWDEIDEIKTAIIVSNGESE